MARHTIRCVHCEPGARADEDLVTYYRGDLERFVAAARRTEAQLADAMQRAERAEAARAAADERAQMALDAADQQAARTTAQVAAAYERVANAEARMAEAEERAARAEAAQAERVERVVFKLPHWTERVGGELDDTAYFESLREPFRAADAV